MNQNDSLFHELDDRMSVVKRWGIVRTIKQQSVAEHCFNVQRIAIKLAGLVGVLEYERLFEISQAALHHDDDEAVTGDIPSPAKMYVHTEKWVDVQARAWYDDASPETKAIVKLADLLEAYHFLALEIRMGNMYVTNHQMGLKTRIMELLNADWCEKIKHVVVYWMGRTDLEVGRVVHE